MNRPWKTAAVAMSAVLLLVVAGVRVFRLADAARWSIVRLQTTTEEQRRLETYGDCGHRGYGYIRHVVDAIPEPDFMPALRYRDFGLFGDRVVPGHRRRSDPRVMLSLGLTPQDVSPKTLSATKLPAPGAGRELWQFQTGQDVDSLIAIVVFGQGHAAGSQSIKLTLFETPARQRVLGQWDFIVSDAVSPWTLTLPARLSPLARSRSEVPFAIETTGTIDLSRLDLMVRPVDTEGYVEVARTGECATLVQQAFLEDITGRPGPWSDWLTGLRGPAK